jgi:hypothetical protein
MGRGHELISDTNNLQRAAYQAVRAEHLVHLAVESARVRSHTSNETRELFQILNDLVSPVQLRQQSQNFEI